MQNQMTRISLKYWHKVMLYVLYSSTWKIANLNRTILPRQTFFADTIYNGVAGNYCYICRILTLNRRSFTNFLACFIALTELESIVVIFFFFTSSNCSNIELSFLFFGTISVLLSRKSSFIVEVFILVLSKLISL